MKKTKVISWDVAFITALILFLSAKSWCRHNLIIGLGAINILRPGVKYHLEYYKIAGKII